MSTVKKLSTVQKLTRANPKACIEGDKLTALIKRIQTAGGDVVKAKGGKGSATLSTAYAASRLVFALLRALNGETNIVGKRPYIYRQLSRAPAILS